MMRLWSVHPGYLDRQGLLGCWRESLLAQAVLRGGTRGYTRHPQITRFRVHPRPMVAIRCYLAVLYQEGTKRGYRFDNSKINDMSGECDLMDVTEGQLDFEYRFLSQKLQARGSGPLSESDPIEPHPLFHVVSGPVEGFERGKLMV